jgi:mediator of RNA polymerase II transcription subunit 12, fungi type
MLQLSELPADMSTEYRQQLRTLLPYTPPNESIVNLLQVSRDASGITSSTVVNRPWEWIENIGEIPTAEAHDSANHGQNRITVKNSAYVPLELFATRATGEAVVSNENARVETNLRSFQDNTSGESVFTRDWIASRVKIDHAGVAVRSRGEEDDQVGALPTFNTLDTNRYSSGSRMASPAGSVRSGNVSVSSSRFPSPLSRTSAATASDSIDVDGISSSASSRRQIKRKASAISISESDGEVQEGPSASMPSAKKTKISKATAKAGAKKK